MQSCVWAVLPCCPQLPLCQEPGPAVEKSVSSKCSCPCPTSALLRDPWGSRADSSRQAVGSALGNALGS